MRNNPNPAIKLKLTSWIQKEATKNFFSFHIFLKNQTRQVLLLKKNLFWHWRQASLWHDYDFSLACILPHNMFPPFELSLNCILLVAKYSFDAPSKGHSYLWYTPQTPWFMPPTPFLLSHTLNFPLNYQPIGLCFEPHLFFFVFYYIINYKITLHTWW